MQAKVQTSRGQIQHLVVQENDVLGGWRVFFDLAGELEEETDLRVWLLKGNQVISETWIYRYQKP